VKAIKLANMEIRTVSSNKDKGARFSVATGELNNEQFSALRDLQGINSKAVISPLDTEETGLIEVESELEQKTQSRRLRGIVAVYCKKKGKPEKSHDVYYREMERLIDKYKQLLDELE